MNNDVLTEILLHLPVQSLLRLRAVCKFWGGFIDSLFFRKLHTHNNNKSDDTVCLQFILSNCGIRVQHNKSLMSYDTDHLKGLGLTLPYRDIDDRFSVYGSFKGLISVYGPVKGLISIDCAKHTWRMRNPFPCQLRAPIAICNPFLGQFKLLPIIPTSSSNSACKVFKRSVAIGYDEDDLKVVQLSWCDTHDHSLAHLYSRNTDSWRELAVDEDFRAFPIDPIKSACENGHFAYLHAYFIPLGLSKILIFDMKNEVFSTIKLDFDFSDGGLKPDHVKRRIFAEDEHSFRRFHFDEKFVHIYETRCDGSKLSWNYVMKVEIPVIEMTPRLKTGFVVFKNWNGESFVYDYCEREFICKLPKGLWIEGRGSFESLEKVN